MVNNVDMRNLRNYEISIWTLQDRFLSVLKWYSLELKGLLQEPTMTLVDDGTQELSFKIPKYYQDGSNLIPNPMWHLVDKTPIEANMHKLKVIFNKDINDLIIEEGLVFSSNLGFLLRTLFNNTYGLDLIDFTGKTVRETFNTISNTLNENITDDPNLERKIARIKRAMKMSERIFEFLVTSVIETHSSGEISYEVKAEGLAFSELGKIGYKIALSQTDYELDEADWFAFSGDFNEEPAMDIHYWNRKIFGRDEDHKRTNWYYKVDMDWSSFSAAEKRLSTLVYEDEYVSSWNVDTDGTLVPKDVTSNRVKWRSIDVKDSNIYNITQTIAETFGIFCRYEYDYNDNYQIIGKNVVYYNNYILDKLGHIDLTYPYSSSSITRTIDASEISTKMYVTEVDSEETGSTKVSIMDTDANKSGEDYILNFDYLYKIGTITQELYDAVEPYIALMHIYNNILRLILERIRVVENEIASAEASKTTAHNAADLDKERSDEILDKINALTGSAGYVSLNTPIAVTRIDSARGLILVNSYQGLEESGVHVYKEYDYTKNEPNSKTEVFNLTFIKDEYGSIDKILIPYASDESTTMYWLQGKYNPVEYYNKVKAIWDNRYSIDKAEETYWTERVDELKNWLYDAGINFAHTDVSKLIIDDFLTWAYVLDENTPITNALLGITFDGALIDQYRTYPLSLTDNNVENIKDSDFLNEEVIYKVLNSPGLYLQELYYLQLKDEAQVKFNCLMGPAIREGYWTPETDREYSDLFLDAFTIYPYLYGLNSASSNYLAPTSPYLTFMWDGDKLYENEEPLIYTKNTAGEMESHIYIDLTQTVGSTSTTLLDYYKEHFDNHLALFYYDNAVLSALHDLDELLELKLQEAGAVIGTADLTNLINAYEALASKKYWGYMSRNWQDFELYDKIKAYTSNDDLSNIKSPYLELEINRAESNMKTLIEHSISCWKTWYANKFKLATIMNTSSNLNLEATRLETNSSDLMNWVHKKIVNGAPKYDAYIKVISNSFQYLVINGVDQKIVYDKYMVTDYDRTNDEVRDKNSNMTIATISGTNIRQYKKASYEILFGDVSELTAYLASMQSPINNEIESHESHIKTLIGLTDLSNQAEWVWDMETYNPPLSDCHYKYVHTIYEELKKILDARTDALNTVDSLIGSWRDSLLRNGIRSFQLNSQCELGWVLDFGTKDPLHNGYPFPVLIITGAKSLDEKTRDYLTTGILTYRKFDSDSLKYTDEKILMDDYLPYLGWYLSDDEKTDSNSLLDHVVGEKVSPSSILVHKSDDIHKTENGVYPKYYEYLYRRVFPRLYFNTLKLKSDESNLLIKLNGGILTNIEDYYTVSDDRSVNGVTLGVGYYTTLKADKLMKLGSSTKANLDVRYTLSNMDVSIYLDAIKIAKENSMPKVSYDVELSALNTEVISTAYDRLNLIVSINDNDLLLENVNGYISSITLNLDKPWEDLVEIKNYETKFEDLFSTIIAQTEAMKKNEGGITTAISSFTLAGLIDSEVLKESISAVKDFSLVAGAGKLTISDKDGIWAISDSGVVAMRGGGIFTATLQDDDGNWIWNTGIIPSGINANLITGGLLDINKIRLYAGNDLKFQWNSEGIYAYKKLNANLLSDTKIPLSDATNYNLLGIDEKQYVLYNSEGLFLRNEAGSFYLKDGGGYGQVTKDIDRVEVSWKGLILRNWTGELVFYADANTGNLTLSGTIKAADGEIGGWLIKPLQLAAIRKELKDDGTTVDELIMVLQGGDSPGIFLSKESLADTEIFDGTTYYVYTYGDNNNTCYGEKLVIVDTAVSDYGKSQIFVKQKVNTGVSPNYVYGVLKVTDSTNEAASGNTIINDTNTIQNITYTYYLLSKNLGTNEDYQDFTLKNSSQKPITYDLNDSLSATWYIELVASYPSSYENYVTYTTSEKMISFDEKGIDVSTMIHPKSTSSSAFSISTNEANAKIAILTGTIGNIDISKDGLSGGNIKSTIDTTSPLKNNSGSSSLTLGDCITDASINSSTGKMTFTRASGTTINFNIAEMAYFKNAVSAAGKLTLTVTRKNSKITIVAKSGLTSKKRTITISSSSDDSSSSGCNNSCTGSCLNTCTGGCSSYCEDACTGGCYGTCKTKCTSSGGGCFGANTLIATLHDLYVTIDSINIGDTVLAYDEETNTTCAATVISYRIFDLKSELVEITFSDGTFITTSASHPFLTTEGWAALDPELAQKEHKIATKELLEGMKVYRKGGSFIEVTKIVRKDNTEHESLYNIGIDKYHTYYANDLIVHNANDGDK